MLQSSAMSVVLLGRWCGSGGELRAEGVHGVGEIAPSSPSARLGVQGVGVGVEPSRVAAAQGVGGSVAPGDGAVVAAAGVDDDAGVVVGLGDQVHGGPPWLV